MREVYPHKKIKYSKVKIMKKKLFAVVALVLIMSILCCNVSIFASSVTPRWTNCDLYSFGFSITDDGMARVGVDYVGDANNLASAKSTVKLQKRFLLVFWNTVDIGYPNNEWVETSTELVDLFYNGFQLSDTGTYHAVLTLEITGKDGSVDVVDTDLEYEYK